MDGSVSARENQLRRLQLQQGIHRVVIDTDTFNEIDDQFALIYALQSTESIEVEGIYAAPFFNRLASDARDGMLKSYGEIVRILELLDRPAAGLVYHGSEGFLEDPKSPRGSAAAQALIARALQSTNEPLYVIAIGALTNVASAILMEPRIIENMVVVWLGGHALHWPHAREFNLQEDLWAAQLVFNCGVPLVHIPCLGVASHLQVTLSELATYVKGQGRAGDYLYETYANSQEDHFGFSRVIWDIAPVAFLVNPEWVRTELQPSPILTDQMTWSVDAGRHWIRYAVEVNRNAIFRDFYQKLRSSGSTKTLN